jgi:hypothetical protein
MAIKQNSRIQIRSGLQQNLPQLAKGELCWAVDTQRLFVGNGTIVDGAPYSGNTEIVTVPNSTETSSGSGLPIAGVPSGSVDGSNNVFHLPSTPMGNTLIVWKNFPLIPGVGYSIAGSTITFTEAPQPDDNLYFFYWQYLISTGSSTVYGNTTVSGIINGVNLIFNLASLPSTPDSLILTLGGVVLSQNDDYTLSGTTITMFTAPQTNSILKAYYVS